MNYWASEINQMDKGGQSSKFSAMREQMRFWRVLQLWILLLNMSLQIKDTTIDEVKPKGEKEWETPR